MTDKVFVYGTLKKDECSVKFLKNCVFEGVGTVTNSALINLKAFPGMILGSFNKKYWAKGEIYTITDGILNILDVIEAEGRLYKRIIAPVETDSGTVWCWTYIFLAPMPEKILIRNGHWRSLC